MLTIGKTDRIRAVQDGGRSAIAEVRLRERRSAERDRVACKHRHFQLSAGIDCGQRVIHLNSNRWSGGRAVLEKILKVTGGQDILRWCRP